MEKKEKMKKTEKGTEKTLASAAKCSDRLCPFHGSEKVKLRGRTFEGTVTKKLHGRVVIEFERVIYLNKYERYEKRKTRLHARLPTCLQNEINEGDLIRIAECRPLSKIIHFFAIQKIKDKMENK